LVVSRGVKWVDSRGGQKKKLTGGKEKTGEGEKHEEEKSIEQNRTVKSKKRRG